MRLICPNCEAQYEVDDAVIPDEGRDVQCSNCSHTWFQPPAGQETAIPDASEPAEAPAEDAPQETVSGGEEADDQATAEAVPPAEPESAPPVEAPQRPETPASPAEFDEDYEDETGEEAESAAPVGQSVLAQRQRTLDESILGILKEEAERESLARQREAQTGLETQGDLGLAEPEAAKPAQQTPASEGTDAAATPPASPAPASAIIPSAPAPEEPKRKDLLPDIEEINSSLRSTSERDAQEPATVEPEVAERAQRRGFRIGFSLMIFLMVILICTYAYAPAIVQRVPESEAAMGQYVDLVNESRVALDGWMGSIAAKLSSLGGSEAVE